MEKLSILLCLLGLTFPFPLASDLKYDLVTCRYSSVPATPDIDQNQYHQLVWQCKDIKNYYDNMSVGGIPVVPASHRAIYQYLQRIATPTAIRLLQDLQKNNFAIY